MNNRFRHVDPILYENAKGLQIIYNVFEILLLWITRRWRSGHWYFDADSFTEPRKEKE